MFLMRGPHVPTTAKTSQTHPIFVNWLLADLPGKVGLTLAPGKHASSKYGGGSWARDLGADLDVLVRDGMELQVCLLEDEELVRLKIPRLIDEAKRRGVDVMRLPIPDGGVLPRLADMDSTVHAILAAARGGRGVVIHCMGGLGRAGTVGGCVLVAAGMSADEALARLKERRGPNCPETKAQQDFIRSYAKRIRSRAAELA